MLSVVLASYNSPEMTKRCAVSILAALKGIDGAELIVVDDCSTERGFTHWCTNHGVRTIQHEQNRGPHTAWNTGIDAAKSGNHIALVGSDVIVPKAALAVMLSLLQTNSHIDLIGAHEVVSPFDTDVIRSCEASWFSEESPQLIQEGISSCCIIRRSVFDAIGGFDEQFVRTFGDTDFHERMLRADLLGSRLTNRSVFHGGSVSRKREGVERDLELDRADHKRFLQKWRDFPEVLERHQIYPLNDLRAAKTAYFNSGEQ